MDPEEKSDAVADVLRKVGPYLLVLTVGLAVGGFALRNRDAIERFAEDNYGDGSARPPVEQTERIKELQSAIAELQTKNAQLTEENARLRDNPEALLQKASDSYAQFLESEDWGNLQAAIDTLDELESRFPESGVDSAAETLRGRVAAFVEVNEARSNEDLAGAKKILKKRVKQLDKEVVEEWTEKLERAERQPLGVPREKWTLFKRRVSPANGLS